MRYATGAKMLGCTVVGATLLLGGAGALGGLDMAMAQSSLLPVETMQRNAVDYDKVANVSGDFTFCQDVVTPADEVFNLFGTATTTLCAKPGYAFDAVTHESYYLNIGGNVEKVYTVGLDEIERMDSKIQKMRCTCGMSPALAMASVKGVKVSDMLSMTLHTSYFFRFNLMFAKICKQLNQSKAAGKHCQHDQIHHICFPPLPDDSNTISIKTGLTGNVRN